MALCRVLCMDFIANGAIGETDEMGNARYSQEDITEGIQYADWLLGDGYTKEPFYQFDLVRFKRWCIKKNPPVRVPVGFIEGSNNRGGNIMILARREARQKRAERGAEVLDRFNAIRGQSRADEADLRDLLSDLMHYARQRKINFDEELTTARMNFDAE